jgi:hypothetical protein
MRLWAKQMIISIRVRKDLNTENARPNPGHTGVIIRGLPDHRDPQIDRLYEDTLASLLDALILQRDFDLLTYEEIAILKQWRTDNHQLAHSIQGFLMRFGLV